MRTRLPLALGILACVAFLSGLVISATRAQTSNKNDDKTVAPQKTIESKTTQSTTEKVDFDSLRIGDIDGRQQNILPKNAKGVGLVFLSTECPIARRYLPEIGRLAKQFHKDGVNVFGVIADPSATRAAAKKWQTEFSLEFPVLFDASGELAVQAQPTHTPEAFVFNAQGELVYRGRIDDFFGDVGRSRQRVTKREFADALKAVANDQRPTISYRKPVGCPVETTITNAKKDTITYCRDVAPIIYQNCAGCHHDGAVAPFPLMSYQDAAKRANWLAEVTKTGLMPPWNAKPGFGHFQDERILTEREIATLSSWAKAGAPLGNKEDLPPTPVFSNDWKLGKPDLVVKMPKAVTIPADGPDVFRVITLPLNLPEDRDIAAVDFRPGNPLVVHHAIIAMAPKEMVANLKETEMPGFDPIKDGLPRLLKMAHLSKDNSGKANFGGLGAWVPGMRPYRMPDGMGIPMSKDACLVLQMHYYPCGKVAEDQSEVAIYYCDKPAKRKVAGFALNMLNLKIPAGEAKHLVKTSLTLPVDATLLGVGPHMHLLGKEMKVTATLPDGKVENLIWIENWDWNWQGQYRFAEPVRLPKGSRLDLVARYDNSADNPANPNTPPKLVQFGRKTTDEMCLCFFQVALDRPEDQAILRRAAFQNMLRQFGNRFGGLLGLSE